MNRSIEQKIRPALIFSALTALIAYFIVVTGPPTNAAGAISLGSASNFLFWREMESLIAAPLSLAEILELIPLFRT